MVFCLHHALLCSSLQLQHMTGMFRAASSLKPAAGQFDLKEYMVKHSYSTGPPKERRGGEEGRGRGENVWRIEERKGVEEERKREEEKGERGERKGGREERKSREEEEERKGRRRKERKRTRREEEEKRREEEERKRR